MCEFDDMEVKVSLFFAVYFAENDCSQLILVQVLSFSWPLFVNLCFFMGTVYIVNKNDS